MGVFSKWAILEKVEDRLESEIINNLNYPFTRVEHILKFNNRSPQFAISSGLAIISALVIIVWVSVGPPAQGILIPAVLFVGGVYSAVLHRLKRDYVVNQTTGKYQYYKGDILCYEGPMHNIYLRLHEKITTGFPYYFIELNAYKVDAVGITGYSRNLKKMRELGKGMSKRLGINYFDVKDISPQHIVHWERPALSESSSDYTLGSDHDYHKHDKMQSISEHESQSISYHEDDYRPP